MAGGAGPGSRRGGVATSLINNPRASGLFYQALLVAALAALIGAGWRNAVVNMQARGIPHGLRLLGRDRRLRHQPVADRLFRASTYGRAFWVGLLNTLLVAAISIALATPLGFAVGVARLSPNWILAKIALRLCRADAQHAAAAAIAVLVQCGAEVAAGAAPVAESRRPRPRSTIAAFICRRPIFGEGAWTIGAALARRRRRARSALPR